MSKKEEINYRYNLKVYWSFVRRYKFLFYLVLFIILINQVSSVVDKFFFKEIVDRGTEFAAGTLARDAFVQILSTILIFYLALSLFKSVTRWLQMHFLNQLESKVIVDLKKKFFDHILRLSYNFHTTHRTGSLISRLLRGGRAVEEMTDVILFSIAPLLFQMIAICISLLYFDSLSALIVFLIVVAFVFYSFFVQKKQRPAAIAMNNADDAEKAQVSDFFMNIDSIKYFGKEEKVSYRFDKIAQSTGQAIVRNWNYYRWMDLGHSFILNIGTFLVILFPILKFLNGQISIGTLTFIYTAFSNIFYPLFSFDHGLRNYYRAMADFESLFQYGKIENEVKDKPDAQALQVKEGSLEYKNVNFSYKQRQILFDFNLKIPAGQKIALVGLSGCGKTTLIKLLFRMYDLNNGQIMLDGHDLTEFKQESLRSEMSMVPQECLLFDDTIYNNIAFSNPKASREEVLEAIKRAQLDKIIQHFPKKEKTMVGERGVKLSGGEKQRVSIARALLANKKILVLDEATSALDSKTESEIQQSLLQLMKNRTSIIIAHRLSTIMNADIIVVMDKGKIIQMGKHHQLIKQSGMYKRLWDLQKGGYIK